MSWRGGGCNCRNCRPSFFFGSYSDDEDPESGGMSDDGLGRVGVYSSFDYMGRLGISQTRVGDLVDVNMRVAKEVHPTQPVGWHEAIILSRDGNTLSLRLSKFPNSQLLKRNANSGQNEVRAPERKRADPLYTANAEFDVSSEANDRWILAKVMSCEYAPTVEDRATKIRFRAIYFRDNCGTKVFDEWISRDDLDGRVCPASTHSPKIVERDRSKHTVKNLVEQMSKLLTTVENSLMREVLVNRLLGDIERQVPTFDSKEYGELFFEAHRRSLIVVLDELINYCPIDRFAPSYFFRWEAFSYFDGFRPADNDEEAKPGSDGGGAELMFRMIRGNELDLLKFYTSERFRRNRITFYSRLLRSSSEFDSWSILHVAADSRNLEMFRYLMNLPECPSVDRKDRIGWTVLHVFVNSCGSDFSKSDAALAKLMFQKMTVNPRNYKTHDGESALTLCIRNNNMKLYRFLCRNRVRPELKDQSPTNCLWYALRNGSPEMVTEVVRCGGKSICVDEDWHRSRMSTCQKNKKCFCQFKDSEYLNVWDRLEELPSLKRQILDINAGFLAPKKKQKRRRY
eukprot:215334_1